MTIEITEREARLYVESIGDKLGYEYTYPPHFPNDRRDVAVLEHAAENGSTYGYTQVFAIAKTADGALRHRELVNSRTTAVYLFIGGVSVAGGVLKVEIRSPGSYSGNPWKKTFELPLRELGL